MTRLAFFAVGLPTTQGSKRAFLLNGRPRMVEQTDRKLKPWRDSVASAAWEARERAGVGVIDGPVAVSLTFCLPRPASAPKRQRWPWRGPDLDKLARAVFDALTSAGVWADDSRCVELQARKVFALDRLGCDITVEVLPEPPVERGRQPVQLEMPVLWDLPGPTVTVEPDGAYL